MKQAPATYRLLVVIILLINSLNVYPLESDRTLRVRCDEAYPPFQYADENGKPVGFDVDLVNALATVLGWKIEITTSPWNQMARAIENDEADLIPGMYFKPERMLAYELSNPILVSAHAFFVRNEGVVQSYNDLITRKDSLTIIIHNSEVLKTYLEGISGKYKLTYVEDNLQGLQLLASGNADAMLLPKHVGLFLVDEYHLSNLRPVGLPVLPRDYLMAARKGNTALIEEVNKGLAIIQETGEYDRIYKKWFGRLENDQHMARWLYFALVAIAVILLVLVVIVISNRFLRKQVGKQTEELNKKISELAQIHEQLKAEKEKAVSTDRLKSAFLANMSHEIRTPMNAIIGFSELLADPDLTKSERDYYASLININSGTLLNLISDIIDISKIEARQLSLRIEPIEPHVLLSDMAPVFQNDLKNRNKNHLVLSYDPPKDGIDVIVLTDPHRFRQIITNLIVNAIKFTSEGYISYGYVKPEENMVSFFVRDSGPGIPEEKRVMIFDRFLQLEQGKHDRQHGAGLGLSITHGLVTLMGGSIWVESQPGEGSIFWFTLPQAPATEVPPESD